MCAYLNVYSIHMPYRSLWSLCLRQGSQKSEDEFSIFSVLGLREQEDFQANTA